MTHEHARAPMQTKTYDKQHLAVYHDLVPLAHLLLQIAQQPVQTDALPFARAFLLFEFDVEIVQYPCIHLQQRGPVSDEMREAREVREAGEGRGAACCLLSHAFIPPAPSLLPSRSQRVRAKVGVARTAARTDKRNSVYLKR